MMTSTVRISIMWVVAGIILLTFNGLIWQKEQLLAQGETIYLELAPVDPRSLLQGDYMVLRYAVSNDIQNAPAELPSRGQVILQLDEQHVGHFARLYDSETPLASDERLLDYHVTDDRVWLGAESFFFQEGQAELYAKAEYGALRLAPNGESLLIGLHGADLEPLGNPD